MHDARHSRFLRIRYYCVHLLAQDANAFDASDLSQQWQTLLGRARLCVVILKTSRVFSCQFLFDGGKKKKKKNNNLCR
jgi:hypothetical protein